MELVSIVANPSSHTTRRLHSRHNLHAHTGHIKIGPGRMHINVDAGHGGCVGREMPLQRQRRVPAWKGAACEREGTGCEAREKEMGAGMTWDNQSDAQNERAGGSNDQQG